MQIAHYDSYFLGRNDWSVNNAEPEIETMPYAEFMDYPGEGEDDYVGFDHFHDDPTVDWSYGCLKVRHILVRVCEQTDDHRPTSGLLCPIPT